MIYIKKQVNRGMELNIEVFSDEFYTKCSGCGKEFPVDHEMLKEIDYDFQADIHCIECTNRSNGIETKI